MISFGAVLGKVTPAQIVWLLVLQVPIYAFNAYLVTEASALSVSANYFGNGVSPAPHPPIKQGACGITFISICLKTHCIQCRWT